MNQSEVCHRPLSPTTRSLSLECLESWCFRHEIGTTKQGKLVEHCRTYQQHLVDYFHSHGSDHWNCVDAGDHHGGGDVSQSGRLYDDHRSMREHSRDLHNHHLISSHRATRNLDPPPLAIGHVRKTWKGYKGSLVWPSAGIQQRVCQNVYRSNHQQTVESDSVALEV